MKRKVKRFSGGGMDDYESSDDAKNLMTAAEREAKDAAPKAKPAASTPAPEMKMASFGEAFKQARGRGDKTFEYQGKKYTTEMAGAKKPAAASTPAPAAKSAAPTPSTTPKSGSYADAAKSSRTLGDVLGASSNDREQYMKDVREGKTKTLGTRFHEGLRKFGRALATGRPQADEERDMKKGGKVKTYKSGGSVSSASKRADGCAMRGKTRGRVL